MLRTLHSNGCTRHVSWHLLCCFVRALPSNGWCLQSHILATGLYAIVCIKYNRILKPTIKDDMFLRNVGLHHIIFKKVGVLMFSSVPQFSWTLFKNHEVMLDLHLLRRTRFVPNGNSSEFFYRRWPFRVSVGTLTVLTEVCLWFSSALPDNCRF
jgi:hypothetical protein